jgi:hypothetical protein
VNPTLARAYGTLAGFGFIGVSALSLPSTRLLDPLPQPEAYFLTLAGVLTGLVCLAIPWERLDPRWLHLVGFAATAETAAAVAVFGPPYIAFYFPVGMLVAYISPDARSIAAQVGLICLAIFGPVAWGPEDARTSLGIALVTVPMLLLSVALFGYLRLKMVSDRRAYHRFAEQTLVLANQISGRQTGPTGLVPRAEPVTRLSRVQLPRTWLAAIGAAVGLPLLAAGLAVAGVALPGLARDSFEGVGIDLPNQVADPVVRPDAENLGSSRAVPARVRTASGGDPEEPGEPSAAEPDGAVAAPELSTPAATAPEPPAAETDVASREPDAGQAEQTDDDDDTVAESASSLLDQTKQDMQDLVGGSSEP